MYSKIIILILIIILICYLTVNENFIDTDNCADLKKKDPVSVCKNYNCCKDNQMNQSCYCKSSFIEKCKNLHKKCLKELNYDDNHKQVCNNILNNCCEYQTTLFRNINDSYDNPINKKSATSLCNFTISDLEKEDCAKMCKYFPKCKGYVYGNIMDAALFASPKQCSLIEDEKNLIDGTSSYYKKK